MATHPPLGQYSTTPVFNTKAVARETEVPADTFRAWERRYGIPRPQRTAGGHRLYSERDIAIIRWLRDRTAEGMNISQAVMLLNNSLAEAAEEPALASMPAPSYEPRAMGRLVEDFTAALVAFDAPRSERMLAEAFALYPIEDVLLHVVQPTMVEIGERWHRGEINVAAEHFATQFVRRKLSAMVNMFDSDAGRGRVIVACAPEELHDLGALFVALFLVRKGWHVIYLGPQVPLPDLLETIHTTRADLVCLSASMPETAMQVSEVVQAIHSAFPQVQVGYGGRIFNTSPELRESIAAIFLGEDAREFTDNVTLLLSRGATSIAERQP